MCNRKAKQNSNAISQDSESHKVSGSDGKEALPGQSPASLPIVEAEPGGAKIQSQIPSSPIHHWQVARSLRISQQRKHHPRMQKDTELCLF